MAKAAVQHKEEEKAVTTTAAVDPKLASDVAPGFTPGAVPAAKDLSKIVTDTPTYGTETPPRQTPPTSIDNLIKHSPPSFHDSNGAKIVSVAPTLASISPATAVAVTGPDLTVTGTGTNFDRATFLTWKGVIVTQTTYTNATTISMVVKPSLEVASTQQVTAKNPAGESVQRAFTLT
jgi:hypothetical protein